MQIFSRIFISRRSATMKFVWIILALTSAALLVSASRHNYDYGQLKHDQEIEHVLEEEILLEELVEETAAEEHHRLPYHRAHNHHHHNHHHHKGIQFEDC